MSTHPQEQTKRQCRALVVDDDPAVRRFISSVLRITGFDVLEAPDAAEALVAFQASGCAVDLVITDCRMPGMNGCELARMLLAARPSLRVLLVSGSHPESTASLHFLQKPFAPASLLDALRRRLAD
jgi:two-component system, cell cycle response regulator CpdR